MTSVLPVNWEEVALKSVVSKLVDGSHNPPKKQDSGKPMLSARNIDNNEIVFDTFRYVRPDHFEVEHKRTRVQPDDVLLTIVGTIGRAAVVPSGLQDFTLQRSVAVMTPEGVLPKFLMYQLQAPHVQRYFEQNARGTAQKGVYLKTLGQTPLRIAPLADQKRIVAEIEKQFSRLDEAVANLKRVKANLKRYKAALLKAAVEGKLTEDWRKSHPDVEPASKLLARILAERRAKWEEAELAKMEAKGKAPKNDKWKAKYKGPIWPETDDLPDLPEGWIWASVDQISDVQLGKMLDRKKHTRGQELPYLRNINVRWGSVDTSDLLTMFFKDNELERFGLQQGDVLVCEGGEPGRAAVWDGATTTMKYQKALHRVRLFEGYSPTLLVCLLEYLAKSGRLTEWFTGSTIKHFTRESFIQLAVPIAPELEQHQLMSEVDRHLSLLQGGESSTGDGLKRAEILRQSILAQQFCAHLPKNLPRSL